ncbi:MAG: hypothetical protein ACXU9U_03010, partial [Parachlamydiaceae bacterium]
MTSTISSEINLKVRVTEKGRSIAIPHTFKIEAELIYPVRLHPDKDEMLDHLLRNPGISNISPFKLVDFQQDVLPSNDANNLHEKLTYTLEPQVPGHYGLTFLQIPFFSEDPSVPPKYVISPIVDLDVVLPEIAEIQLDSEMAPLATLSQREPIELATAIRSHVMRDHSAHNLQAFQSKVIPWQPILLVATFLLLTWLVRRALSYKKGEQPLASKQQVALTRAEEILNRLKGQSMKDSHLVEAFVVELTN